MERESGQPNPLQWLAGGMVLASVIIALNKDALDGLKSVLRLAQPDPNQCQTMVKPQATMSRAVLSQLLSVPSGVTRQQLQPLLSQPYCQLPPITSDGVTLQREAYPLAFDLSIWLVVLYDRDTYISYDFNFR